MNIQGEYSLDGGDDGREGVDGAARRAVRDEHRAEDVRRRARGRARGVGGSGGELRARRRGDARDATDD